MSHRNNSVTVDLDGLAKLVADKSKAFILTELYANAADNHDAKNIRVLLSPLSHGHATISVIDDSPEGFRDLSHAWTLFADSFKKDDSATSGRFNLGEKLVIALAKSVKIQTTTGTVEFNATGRHESRSRRDAGTEVTAFVQLSKDEYQEAVSTFGWVIPRNGQRVFLTADVLGDDPLEIKHRKPLAVLDLKLPVPLADGFAADLKTRIRNVQVEIHEPLIGEVPTLYELGIPVVPNGGKHSYNVLAKVPLPFDRDNVPASYLQTLHVAVVNALSNTLTQNDANAAFVREAIADHRIDRGSFETVKTLRYGEKAVVHNPTDPEATHRAVALGYTVLHGRQESTGFFERNREFGSIPTATDVCPTPKPYTAGGKPVNVLLPEKWTDGILRVEQFCHLFFDKAVAPGKRISVRFITNVDANFVATYGPSGELTFNVGRLGYKWFDRAPAVTAEIIDLIIHEAAHDRESNHLSENYYNALTDIGAAWAVYAITHADELLKFRTVESLRDILTV